MNRDRVLPQEVHFNEDACQIVQDIDSTLDADYAQRVSKYVLADGLRDMSTCQGNSFSDAENLAALVEAGKTSWIGIGWLLLSPSFVCAARKKGMSPVDYADWLYRKCEEINQKAGFRAAWMEAYGEIGNSLVWPMEKRYSKKDALAYFRKWFTSSQSHMEHWHQIVEPEVLSFYSHAKRKNENFRELPLYYTDGTLFALQEAFRAGFPMVVYEGGAGTLNPVQMGIASVRGGAKMFDTFWGVDMSPWTYGPLGTVASTNNSGSWCEGLTPDAMFRIWLSVYLSGANMFLHEVGHTFFYTQSSSGEIGLSDYGCSAMHFYRLKEDILADRGRPVVPFAIMLEEENGYRGDMIREMTPAGELKTIYETQTPDERLLIWQNHVSQVTRGDWQIYRTLSMLWPTPNNEWKKMIECWPEKNFIDHNPENNPELTARIKVGQNDPRDYAKYISDSAFADSFDIIPEDVAEERLSQYYRVLLLTGEIRTDSGLWEKIAAFTEKGGTVVLSLEQADETAIKALGISSFLESQIHNVTSVRTQLKPHLSVDETLMVHHVRFDSARMNVWAADEKTNQPLVLEIKLGKGRIYLLLFSYGMDRDGRKLSDIYRELLETLYVEHAGVYKKGPACQMIVNQRSEDTLVTLLNHSKNDWHGEIIVKRALHPVVEEVRDLIVDAVYPESLVCNDSQMVSVQVRVPAYETKILSFGKKRSTQTYRGITTSMSSQSEQDRRYREEILKQGPAVILGS
jgi:hypothetical protein